MKAFHLGRFLFFDKKGKLNYIYLNEIYHLRWQNKN